MNGGKATGMFQNQFFFAVLDKVIRNKQEKK